MAQRHALPQKGLQVKLSDRVQLFHAEARVEGILCGFVGVFESAQTGRSRHTHRTQVSFYEAHCIPWLEHKISFPQCTEMRGIVLGDEVKSVRHQG